jgi:hypothetical protein
MGRIGFVRAGGLGTIAFFLCLTARLREWFIAAKLPEHTLLPYNIPAAIGQANSQGDGDSAVPGTR